MSSISNKKINKCAIEKGSAYIGSIAAYNICFFCAIAGWLIDNTDISHILNKLRNSNITTSTPLVNLTSNEFGYMLLLYVQKKIGYQHNDRFFMLNLCGNNDENRSDVKTLGVILALCDLTDCYIHVFTRNSSSENEESPIGCEQFTTFPNSNINEDTVSGSNKHVVIQENIELFFKFNRGNRLAIQIVCTGQVHFQALSGKCIYPIAFADESEYDLYLAKYVEQISELMYLKPVCYTFPVVSNVPKITKQPNVFNKIEKDREIAKCLRDELEQIEADRKFAERLNNQIKADSLNNQIEADRKFAESLEEMRLFDELKQIEEEQKLAKIEADKKLAKIKADKLAKIEADKRKLAENEARRKMIENETKRKLAEIEAERKLVEEENKRKLAEIEAENEAENEDEESYDGYLYNFVRTWFEN